MNTTVKMWLVITGFAFIFNSIFHIKVSLCALEYNDACHQTFGRLARKLQNNPLSQCRIEILQREGDGEERYQTDVD